jgi:hypothetical protein
MRHTVFGMIDRDGAIRCSQFPGVPAMIEWR